MYSIISYTEVEKEWNWSLNFSQFTNLFLCKESIRNSRPVAPVNCCVYRSYICRPTTSHEGMQVSELNISSHSKIQHYVLESGQFIPVMSPSYMQLLGLPAQLCWMHRSKENLFLLLEIEPRFLSHPHNVVTILTTLFRLSLTVYIHTHTHTHTHIYI